MQAVLDQAHLGIVTNDRGAEIQRRLDRLNLSDRDFERRTGVERKTLRRAIDEGDRTRESTWRNIEVALDQLEAKWAGEPSVKTPAGDPHIVTIRGTRGGDIDIVVSGPVEDIETLTATVERLLRAGQPDSTEGEDSPK